MRIADVLPLTSLQQGLLFHTSTAQASNDVYALQLGVTVTGPLEPHRLRAAVHTVVKRHPHLVARFSVEFDEPVQIIPADPVAAWRYDDLSAATSTWRSKSGGSARRNAPAIWPMNRRSGSL